jgi:hypothetical protein
MMYEPKVTDLDAGAVRQSRLQVLPVRVPSVALLSLGTGTSARVEVRRVSS